MEHEPAVAPVVASAPSRVTITGIYARCDQCEAALVVIDDHLDPRLWIEAVCLIGGVVLITPHRIGCEGRDG